MKHPHFFCTLLFASLFLFGQAQTEFDYSLELEAVQIDNFNGLHSYVFGQSNGKWLLIGGRKDGLHARQPFNAFPEAMNNTEIIVVDAQLQQSWSASLDVLPTGIREQLQSTNMNFFQDGDSLYIIGGYAYAQSAANHITFDKLTAVQVTPLIEAIVSGTSISPYFKQIQHSLFAITGGQLGKIGNTFYLVGGHRFDGRYNPMGNPTYTQTYSNQIRMFEIDNTGNQLSVSNMSNITDPVHLRRRDYNLLARILPDGSSGYTISSGVFQQDIDLPFLYPVDITEDGYEPHTNFNQYLSNYHSAHANLFDSISNNMHSLFFGGISQYYYNNGTLVQDNFVPFVRTISRLSRDSEGNFYEFQLPVEMPGLLGASAEFIPNRALETYENDVIKLHSFQNDTMLIGHVLGGIYSTSLNPFTNNQTNTTVAASNIYAVKLIRNSTVGEQQIDGSNPYQFNFYPNPVGESMQISFDLAELTDVSFFITNMAGQMIRSGQIEHVHLGNNLFELSCEEQYASQTLLVTLVFDHRYFTSKKLLRTP